MALDTFIAGAYVGTYNSTAVGSTEAGFELQTEAKAETIEESDTWGNTIVDFIYRGGNHYLQFLCKAYKAGSTAPFWPWGTMGVMGVIGRLASDVSAATVLTATASTPAAAAPASLTGTKSILAPNFPASLLFNSKLRQVPVRLQFLPYDAGAGAIKWYTTT